MKAGTKQANRKNKVRPRQWRRWKAGTLTPEDYAFAVSIKRIPWTSPSHTWDRHIVNECLNWELEREFSDCDKPPFVVAHRERIKKAEAFVKPSPAAWPEINEMLNLGEAVRAIQMQPAFPGSTFHVIEIEHGETLDVTVQRFRNWLTAKDRVIHIKERNEPDEPVKFVTVQEFLNWPTAKNRVIHIFRRVFQCANGTVRSVIRSDPGRKDNARKLLRAIAVRRIKQADQTRKLAAEKFLRLDDAQLGPDQWKAFPKDADNAIAELEQTMRVFSVRSLDELKFPQVDPPTQKSVD
jgi:hypothetical protein